MSLFHSYLLMFVCLLAGCSGAIEQLFSRPNLAESVGVSRDGQIQQSGMQIYVRPTNSVIVGMGSNLLGFTSIAPSKHYRQYVYYPKAYALADSPGRFYIEFYVRTERSLSVSLDRFFLTLPDGKTKKPIAYLGSLAMFSTRNYSLHLCKPNLLKETSVDIPIVIHKSESMCFAAIYDVDPPMPSDLFRLEIDGISVEGKKLNIPAVVFEQSKEIDLHP